MLVYEDILLSVLYIKKMKQKSNLNKTINSADRPGSTIDSVPLGLNWPFLGSQCSRTPDSILHRTKLH